jgi:hypothetical protein
MPANEGNPLGYDLKLPARPVQSRASKAGSREGKCKEGSCLPVLDQVLSRSIAEGLSLVRRVTLCLEVFKSDAFLVPLRVDWIQSQCALGHIPIPLPR